MFRRHLAEFIADQDGATAIEYAIIASLIAVVIVACLAVMGPALIAAFERTAGFFPG